MSSKEDIDLCVVLPVRNEEESIVAVVSELCATLTVIPALQRIALLVIDDHSQDNSIPLLKEWFIKQQLTGFSLTVIRLQQRHGVSMALLKGFKLAATWKPHLTMVMDADGQDSPTFATELIDKAGRADIVFALRGKRSESLFFRFCYTSFQMFMKITTGSYARTNQFCVMRQPTLAYVASMNYIDYLGALLQASSFSRDVLTAARRKRLAGVSKFSFFEHALTAAIIVSWRQYLVKRLHTALLLLTAVIGTIAVTTANPIAIAATLLVALLVQVWHMLLTKILVNRANSTALEFDEQVDEVLANTAFHKTA